MASTSQRQFRPSNGDRLTRTGVFGNLRARFATGTAFLLLSCLVHSTVLASASTPVSHYTNLATRTFKVVTIGPGCGGFFGHVRIDLESEGNEAAAGFTIGFNPAILSNPIVSLGADAGFFILTTNTNQLAQGRIGILIDSGLPNPVAVSPPDRRMVQIRFDVAPGAPAGSTPITFIPNNAVPAPPTLRSTSNSAGDLLTTAYQDANLVIGGTGCATSASVSVSGRVVSAGGTGVRGAEVFIVDPDGNRRKVLTSSLGYYQFDEVESGKSYVLGVSSRRYRFESKALQINDNLANVDFVGQE